MSASEKLVAYLPTYKFEQWERWSILGPVFGVAADSFEGWREQHAMERTLLLSRGMQICEVEIDIDDYLTWSGRNRFPLNKATQKEFAKEIFSRGPKRPPLPGSDGKRTQANL
jgi:hypothetical protein